MQKMRKLTVGLAALALATVAGAQFDGPAPLAWRWIQPTRVAPGGSPLVEGNTIYQAVGGRVFSLDKESGNLRWRFPAVEPIQGVFRSTPVLAAGTLVAAGDNKLVYGIDPATGQSKWSFPTPASVIGQPVVAGNLVVFALSDNRLMAVNPENGQAGWENPLNIFDGVSGQLSAHGGNVMVFTNRGEMLAINTTTRKTEWKQRFSQVPPNPSATVYGDNVFLVSGPFVIALNATTGTARYQIDTRMQLALPPAVSSEGIFVVSQDGKAMAYDLSRQAITKKAIDLGSLAATRPTAVGNKFIVPTTNGGVVLVDPTKSEIQWNFVIRPLADATTAAPTTGGPGGPGGPGGFGGPGGPGGRPQNSQTDRVVSIAASAPAVLSGQTLLVPARDGSLLAFDRNLGVDLTAPKVSMLFPNAGDQVSGQPPLVFLFRLEDEAAGVRSDSVKVEVDGQALEHTLNRDGTLLVRFSQTGKNRPLQDGRRTIVVTAVDWMGNTVKQNFALTIDNALKPITLPGQNNNQGGPGGGPGGFGGAGGDGGLR